MLSDVFPTNRQAVLYADFDYEFLHLPDYDIGFTVCVNDRQEMLTPLLMARVRVSPAFNLLSLMGILILILVLD
jgi:hypothetical protein